MQSKKQNVSQWSFNRSWPFMHRQKFTTEQQQDNPDADFTDFSYNIANEPFGEPPYQTAETVKQARRAADGVGFGNAIVSSLMTGILGPNGIQIDWGDPTLQSHWENWAWSKTWTGQRWKELQFQVLRGLIVDGEVFVVLRKEIIGGITQEFKVEIIDALDLPMVDTAQGGNIQQGIRFSNTGEIVSYLFSSYNTGTRRGLRPNQVAEVDAADVLHVFRQDRSKQVRGVSWIRPSLSPLQAIETLRKDYQKLVNQQMRIPGMFGMDREATAREGDMSDADGNKEGLLKRTKRTLAASRLEVPVIPAGLEFISMKLADVVSSQEFSAMREELIQAAARGADLQTFTVTGDVSRGNFSSYRHGAMENIKVFRRGQGLLINLFIKPLLQAWLEWERLRLPSLPMLAPRTMLPPNAYIDPQKEATATQKEIQMGVKTISEVIRNAGGKPEEVFVERAKEKRLIVDAYIDAGFDEDVAMREAEKLALDTTTNTDVIIEAINSQES